MKSPYEKPGLHNGQVRFYRKPLEFAKGQNEVGSGAPWGFDAPGLRDRPVGGSVGPKFGQSIAWATASCGPCTDRDDPISSTSGMATSASSIRSLKTLA